MAKLSKVSNTLYEPQPTKTVPTTIPNSKS